MELDNGKLYEFDGTNLTKALDIKYTSFSINREINYGRYEEFVINICGLLDYEEVDNIKKLLIKTYKDCYDITDEDITVEFIGGGFK